MTVLIVTGAVVATASTQPSASGECSTWQQCRDLALAAAAEGAFERFHDLAWRAVQAGPERDPQLMYLLARAMSLSGRPHDALVMVRRLAEMGVATDAASSDDFRSVRRLKEWPAVATRILVVAATKAAPAMTVSRPMAPGGGAMPASYTPGPAAAEAAAVSPRPGAAATEALRVPALAIHPVDLAYDRDSARYIVGDARGRRLLILDERLRRSMDLVREQSAGFYDITALEIDRRRGDLWVVSADAAGATALHHLQLVSGRPLATVNAPPELGPARFVDVAVGAGGTVYVLDAAGRRVFRLLPRSGSLQVVAELSTGGLRRLAVAPHDVLYVAHDQGVLRVEAGGRVLAVRADRPIPQFTRLWWRQGSLIGVQDSGDQSRVVRLALDAAGTRALTIATSEVVLPGNAAASLVGDTVCFVTGAAESAAATVVARVPLP